MHTRLITNYKVTFIELVHQKTSNICKLFICMAAKNAYFIFKQSYVS